MDQICERKSDGKFYEPSVPEDYNIGKALVDLINNKQTWYFREIKFEKSKWWKFWRKGKWVRTGRVWEPIEGSEFKVRNLKENYYCEKCNVFFDYKLTYYIHICEK